MLVECVLPAFWCNAVTRYDLMLSVLSADELAAMHHRYLPQGTVGALSAAIPPLALKPIDDQEKHTKSALLVRVQLASVNADGRVAVQLATALRMNEIDTKMEKASTSFGATRSCQMATKQMANRQTENTHEKTPVH